jgi:hypothetical protein
MQLYIVLYRTEDIMAPADPPFSFQCWAEDTEHAEEQMLNAEPDADIVWVVQAEWPPKLAQDLNAYHLVDGDAEVTAMLRENVQKAYNDYWNTPTGFTDDETN